MSFTATVGPVRATFNYQDRYSGDMIFLVPILITSLKPELAGESSMASVVRLAFFRISELGKIIDWVD